MTDKIINGSIEVTGKIDNEVTNRFEKVYINELSQDVKDWLNGHFNDSSYSINLSGEELTYSFKYLYECLNNLNPSSTSKGFSYININSFSYGELSQSYCYYGLASTSIKESTYFVFDYSAFINEHPETASFVDKNYVLCTLAGYPSSRTIKVNYKSYFSDIKQAIIKDLLTNKGYQVILTEDKVQEKIDAKPSGTKLYKHTLNLNYSNGNHIDCIVITPNSTRVENAGTLNALFKGNFVYSNIVMRETEESTSEPICYGTGSGIFYNGQIFTGGILIVNGTPELSYQTGQSIFTYKDVVTEL